MAAGETNHVAELASASTALVNDARKFDYFCDGICDVYTGIEPAQSSNRVFDAEFSAYAMSGAVLATIAAPGHCATRSPTHLRRRPDDSLFLNFCEFSVWRAEHCDETWQLPPATPFLIDNDRPFHLDFDRSRRMVLSSLRFDRQALGVDLSKVTLTRINLGIGKTPTGRQLAQQTRLMCQALRAGNLALADMMSRPVLGLLQALAADVAGPAAGTRGIALSDIKAVALGHLNDPDFAIAHLARVFHCSSRTIQMRFSAEGESFGRWLLAERLDLVRHRLQAPEFAGRSIEMIAYASGFRDASHFHRAFRDRFGMPPGQLRGAQYWN